MFKIENLGSYHLIDDLCPFSILHTVARLPHGDDVLKDSWLEGLVTRTVPSHVSPLGTDSSIFFPTIKGICLLCILKYLHL